MRLQRSVSDDLRVAVECGNQVGTGTDTDTDDFRKGDGAEDAEACASLARSYCFAPRFWLIKVVSAREKQVIGKSRSPRLWNRHRSQPLPFFQSC